MNELKQIAVCNRPRLLAHVPEVAEKIEDGSLNLTQLTEVQKCVRENGISAEKTLEVLEKLENKNSFETQKTLAIEMDLPVQVHEKVKPQADKSVCIELILSEEDFEELEQAKSILSHTCPEGSWSKVIAKLAKEFNQRKLVGRQKAKNIESERSAPAAQEVSAANQAENPTQCVLAAREKRPTKRKPISLKIKRQLFQKAGHCCEFQDPKTDTRCNSKYQLQIDHIQPVAHGGGHELENLRVLCRTHNLLAARSHGLGYEN